MIHGLICRIRHVGYVKIYGCLIVHHPLKYTPRLIRQCCKKNRTCSIFTRLHFHVLLCFHMPHVIMAVHVWRNEKYDQLVRLYENHPCLYNTTSKDHMDKNKRMGAFLYINWKFFLSK